MAQHYLTAAIAGASIKSMGLNTGTRLTRVKLAAATLSSAWLLIALSSCSSDDKSGASGNETGGTSSGSTSSGGTGTGGADSCTPKSCAEDWCGSLDDGCGNNLDCGGCEAPLSCAGDGTANRCTQLYGWVPYDSDSFFYDVEAFWGASPDDLWAVAGGGSLLGGSGELHSFDGIAWDLYYTMPEPAYTDIHGVGEDIFVVGHGPQFLWFDGQSVTVIENGGGQSNMGVWASAPDAVWVASESTTRPLRLWNGEEFDSFAPDSPNSAGALAVWGSSADDVWALDTEGVLHFDGSEWSQVHETTAALTNLHGSGPNDVWAVGPRVALHFDGTSWSEHPDGAGQALFDVWAAAPDDVWFVGSDGKVMHGGVGGFDTVPSGITESLFAVWGTSPTDIWAGGEGGVLIHYEPVDEPVDPGPTEECNPQGYGCTESPCCAPFVCGAFGGTQVCM